MLTPQFLLMYFHVTIDSWEEAFFLTGLDEHGQKVQQAAESKGVTPIEHCNKMAPRFVDLWRKLHIQYDDFIRTTEKDTPPLFSHYSKKSMIKAIYTKIVTRDCILYPRKGL